MKRTLLLFALAAAVWSEPLPVEVPSNDGQVLPGQIDLPADSPKGVVVLLHGSGAHGRDEELGSVTKDQAANPFFANLSAALNRHGLAVLRYDKHNFALKGDPRLREAPLQTFVDDALSAVRVAHAKYPDLPVVLLGHSEGCTVALHAAERAPSEVAALAFISWVPTSLEALVHEQYVDRYAFWFARLDRDGDGRLQEGELPSLLRPQLPVLDLDADGCVAYSEFQAGNLSNGYLHPVISDAWRREEAALPSPAQCVANLRQRMAFFQGEWDNQTPAYGVKALEICERQVWKQGNKRFFYFPRAGHALDPRTSYEDTTFQRTSQATLEKVAGEVERLLAR